MKELFVKWVLLIVAFACVLPLTDWLRSNPRETPKIWILVGFLILQHGPLHLFMAIESWAGFWPGYTQGAEISLLDLIILAIYLSLPGKQDSLPFRFSIAFYFFSVLFSVFQASVPHAALFYPWQLARIFFVYAVVTKACADPRVPPALLKGMAMGLFLAACEAIWERYGLGILKTSGGYSSQNFLGLVSHFVVFPYFAMLLVGERGWFAFMTPFAGMITAILTTSRATVGFAGLGYVGLFMISALRGWTPWKTKIAAAGVIVVILLTPLFLSSFEDRFGSSDIQSAFLGTDESRVQMSQAASMMLSDHPMGVGANHFVQIAITQGYYARSGLSWTAYGNTVHNVYWLVAAETGYLGLVAFVIFLLRPLTVAFLCGWRNRGDKRGDLLLGLGVALLVVCIHSFYEWVFITFGVQYIFAATMGLIAGLAQQLGYWRRSRPIASRSSDIARPAAEVAPQFRIKSNR